MPEFIPAHTPDNLDAFTLGYLECAEWLAHSYGTEEEDRADFSMTDEEQADCTGFDPDAIKQAVQDCADFQAANETDLLTYYSLGGDESHAGHDFYLSRNGHGAGFFDRGYDPVYNRLQGAARSYGEADCMYDPDTCTLFLG